MGPELTVIMSIGKAVLSFAGAMSQASAQRSAARKQEAAAERSKYLAERNAAAIERETAEEARRTGKAQRRQEKLSIARAAASGGTIGGSASTQAFFDEMRSENDSQLDWLMEAGNSRAQTERTRGEFARLEGYARADATRAQARQSQMSGFGSLIGGLGGAATSAYDAGMFGGNSVSPDPPALDAGWDYYYPTTYSMT